MKTEEVITILFGLSILGYAIYKYTLEETSENNKSSEEQPKEETKGPPELTLIMSGSFVSGIPVTIQIHAKNLKGATLSVPSAIDGIGYMFDRKSIKVYSDDFKTTVEVKPRERDDVTYPVTGDFVVVAYSGGEKVAEARRKITIYKSEEQREFVTISSYVTTYFVPRLENGHLKVTVGATLNPSYPANIKKIKLIRVRSLLPDEVIEKALPAYRPPSFTAEHTFDIGELRFPTLCTIITCRVLPLSFRFRVEVDGINYVDEKEIVITPNGKIEVIG